MKTNNSVRKESNLVILKNIIIPTQLNCGWIFKAKYIHATYLPTYICSSSSFLIVDLFKKCVWGREGIISQRIEWMDGLSWTKKEESRMYV